MSITYALSNAASGMSAASRKAAITSHNIANATTPGYARQSVSTVHDVVAGRGNGVLVSAVERSNDPRLTANRRDADGEASGSQAEATAARNLADQFQGASSLFDRIAALETNLRGVSENPQSGALQERAVSAASGVVLAFQNVSETVQTERTEADRSIANAVDDVNAALVEIERLNTEIGFTQVSTASSAAFEQQRDDQIDIVAKYLPVRSMPRGNGQIALFTDTGVALVDNTAKELSFSAVTVVTADMDHRAGASPLSGLTVDGVEITPKSGTQAIETGLIAGLFEVRDGALADANAEIDALAADMIERFEAAGIAGTDGRGLFTDDGSALVPPSPAGLAGRISLNEQVDPAQGGSAWRIRDGLDAASPGPVASSGHANALLEAMTEVRLAGGSTGRAASAAGLAGDLGSLFERRGQSAEDRAASDQIRFTTFESAESEIIGVDLDRELQSLILIEQAYGANAKVIQVADRLIQRLLEI